MPSIVEFRRAEWTVNSISLLRYTAKTYSQMTGEWQQNNVFFLMWDTWKNYKPRSQVFHVSHIREISLICCHSAVCGAHFLHWNQNPKFWVTWHISETETNKCLLFHFWMIRLIKTPILPNCQVPNGFFLV